MPEEQSTTLQTPTVTQGNDATARTATGEIKDQQATQTVTTPQDETAKSTDTKASDAKTEDAKKPAEPGVVPEKYDLKAPEGYEIDPKMVEEFTPIAKELGLTNEQAQKLADVWNKHSIESAEAPYKAYEEFRTKGRDEIVKDPALGDGKDNLKPEVRANISKVYDAIGDAKLVEAFKADMDLTGSGDRPSFVRVMNAVGKLLSEGTLVRGAGPASTGQTASGNAAKPTPAQALYPNNPSSAQRS